MAAPKSMAELQREANPASATDATVRGTERTTAQPTLYPAEPSAFLDPVTGRVVAVVNWAGLPIPVHTAHRHFVIAGVPGTGKTVAVRKLLHSVLSPTARPHLSGTDRAVIYDAKRELYPFLLGIGVPETRIDILNPFDARSSAWCIAKDYRSPAAALQLAKFLIPCPESHSQPFFPKSAAALLATTLTAFMKTQPDVWDLLLVITACTKRERMKAVWQEADPHKRNPYIELARSVFAGSADTTGNVVAELTSHLFEYLPVAEAWRAAAVEGKTFSVTDFVGQPDRIALLGASQTHSTAVQAVNRLLVKRLAEVILDTPGGQWRSGNRTWLVLDEVRELGQVDGLPDLINKGRDRGVCGVIGFQDYVELEDAFGKGVAHAITATAAYRLFLRLGGESAEWASRAFSKAEVSEAQVTVSSGTNFQVNSSLSATVNQSVTAPWGLAGSNFGTFTSSYAVTAAAGVAIGANSQLTSSEQKKEKDVVLSSEIAGLPDFDTGGGLTGFSTLFTAEGKAVVYRLHVAAKDLTEGMKDSDDAGYEERTIPDAG